MTTHFYTVMVKALEQRALHRKS